MLTLIKILSLLVYPLSLGLMLLLLSVVAQMKGRRGTAVLLNVLGVVIIYYAATLPGARFFSEPLEAQYPAFAPGELPKADAIVILGGAVSPQGQYGYGGDFNQAADRLWAGVALFKAELAPLLVLSGGALSSPVPEAELMAEKLTGMGVEREALLLETESKNTYQNAVNTATLLKERDISHILLVTSGTHMRRALALFAAQGLQVTAAPTDHYLPSYPEVVPDWLPTAERLSQSHRAIHEWVGYWVADIRGQL